LGKAGPLEGGGKSYRLCMKRAGCALIGNNYPSLDGAAPLE
jgi:hypothetical protein